MMSLNKLFEKIYRASDLLEAIAKDELGLPTLSLRGRDELDFHDLSVSSIRRALQRAYNAGHAAAQGQMRCTAQRKNRKGGAS